jgi:glycosyltransferase involved in cell wall biosynthesis
MNIAIDIRSTLKNRTGVGIYTFGLVNALAKIDRESDYLLYSYIRLFDFKRRLWRLPGRNFRHKVDRLSFAPDRALRDADVLHTSSYDMPHSASYGLFTTVHDLIPLIFPEGYADDYLQKLEGSLKRVLSESKAIITDSINTKNDIERSFPGATKRVEVVYPGRDESFKALDKDRSRKKIKDKYGIEGAFLLYSGGMDHRKNVIRLVEAFEILKSRYKIPHKLVLLGTKGKKTANMENAAKRSGLGKDVIFTGYVPYGDLNPFYSAADCFVYPSLYEGFGFPILEAFASNVPVVTSSTSSCGEIAGDAAVAVDPSDTERLAEAIRRVVSDREFASSLAEKGRERVKDFSWESSAKRVLELFRGN